MPIIPITAGPQQTRGWQNLLAQAITDPRELLHELGLSPQLLPAARSAGQDFRLRVPRGFVARMRHGDAHDPLLRQVLPLGDELVRREGYSSDPLRELGVMPVPGLLHKYQGRVLLTTTGACAVHCRYCFRRHYPYAEANPNRQQGLTLDYLRDHPGVEEVILSGGDPLSLSDNRLSRLVMELQSLGHLKRLRIHTRVPVVLPERVDSALLDWLRATRLQVIMVIHCNHANEIDASVAAAMQSLREAGVCLLNQSVLLRGVNDRADILANLSERLFSAGVLPYYLHQLDPVQGAAHFAVPDKEAKNIVNQLVKIVSGYLVPRLVREEPEQGAKTAL